MFSQVGPTDSCPDSVDGSSSGKVAFLFPGQGSQRPGMLMALAEAWPAFRNNLCRFDQIWPAVAGKSIRTHLLSDSADELRDTTIAQPALGLVSAALAHALCDLGLEPVAVAGHSYGELVALHVAGAFDLETLGRLSVERGRLLGAAGDGEPGGMVALGAGRDQVAELVQGLSGVVLANENAPRQTVVAGVVAGLEGVMERARGAGVSATRLQTSAAFHSPWMASAATQWRETLAAVPVTSPRLPVYANVTAAPYAWDGQAVREGLTEQLTAPVRWQSEIEALYEAGVATFVEVGPGRVLTGLTRRILGDRPHWAFSLDGGDDGAGPLSALCSHMESLGVSLRWSAVQEEAMANDSKPPPSLGGLDRFFAGNQQVVDRFFVQQQELLAHFPLPAEGSDSRFLRMVEANQAVMADFFETQRAALRAASGEPLGVSVPAVAGAPTRELVEPAGQPALEGPAVDRQDPSAPALTAHSSDHAGSTTPELSREHLTEWLRQQVSEVTGLPVGMVGAKSKFENDLGLDSISTVEILGKFLEAYPQFQALGQSLRTVRSIAEVVDLALAPPESQEGAADDGGPSPSPLQAPAEVPASGGDGDASFGDELLEELSGLLRELSGGTVPRADGNAELEQDLGVDAFTRAALVEAWLRDRPALRLAGRALEQAGSLGEMARLAEQVLGAPPAAAKEPVERFVRSALPLVDEDASQSLEDSQVPPAFWVMSPLAQGGEAFAESLRQRGSATCELVGSGEGIALSASEAGPATDEELESLVQQWAAASFPLGQAGAPALLLVLPAAESVATNEGWRSELESHVVAPFSLMRALDRVGLRPSRVAIVASGQASVAAAGARGLGRALVHEWPEVPVRALWLHDEPTAPTRDRVLVAVSTGDSDQELALSDGQLLTHRLVRVPLAGRSAEVPSRGLHLLLVGGGDGITAEAGVMLAERLGCRLSVVGRTAWSAEYPYPDIAHAAELASRIRQETVDAADGLSPRQLQQRIATRLALVRRQRALWATKERIEAAGGAFGYARADATDKDELGAALAELRQQADGPFQGLVHGAGIIDDGPLATKTAESFRKVLFTKALSAQLCRDLLEQDPLQFAFLFSSLTAYTGNAGQADYVAANEIVDQLARQWNGSVSYPVRALAWSVWSETGLAPQAVVREMGRLGVGGITNADGVAALWAELTSGFKSQPWALWTPVSALNHLLRAQNRRSEGRCAA
jgi:malonyl CoA-acyl carrier protein transacylase